MKKIQTGEGVGSFHMENFRRRSRFLLIREVRDG